MPVGNVDRTAKVIYGYTVMSKGEARGHGFVVDDQTLDQLVELGNASPAGIKTRVRHRDGADDGFGRYLGPSKTFRRDGDRVVADLHIAELAFHSLSGDLGTYVMEMAESADSMFGASPELRGQKLSKPTQRLPSMRPTHLLAIAIVDDPATNPGGFFSLSAKDDDAMSPEEQIAQLTAERDELKTKLTKVEGDQAAAAAAQTVALSALRTEVETKVRTDERARAADIIALCSKAKQFDLAAKHIPAGTSTSEVQSALIEVLCSANRPLGEGSSDDDFGGAGNGADPDKRFKSEYAAMSAVYTSEGVSEADYVAMRRVDCKLDTLGPKS